MQVSTLSAQMGLGTELVDRCRDATSVPYVHLLIDLSSRRDDRIRYCTNTGPILSEFYIPDQMKQTMNTQNLSNLQVFQSFSHKCKSLFLQSYPKDFIRFPCECIKNLPKRNLQILKKHHAAEFQSEVRLSLKRTT